MRAPAAALCLFVALSAPLHASSLGNFLWDRGAARVQELIDEARRLRLTGLSPARNPIAINLSALEAELADLRSKIDQIRSPKPALGAFFEEGESGAVISSLLIGGPLDRAGLKPGDVIVEVDGRAAEGYSALSQAAHRGPVSMRVKGRSAPLIVRAEPPRLFPEEDLRAVLEEFKFVESELSRLRQSLGNPRLDRGLAASQARVLALRMARLKDKISGLWTRAALGRYRNR